MLKNYYKKYRDIIRYKNQLIYMIAVWEPKEEKKAFACFLKAPRELHSLRAENSIKQHHYKRSCASGTLF